jgi:hypothetical protein
LLTRVFIPLLVFKNKQISAAKEVTGTCTNKYLEIIKTRIKEGDDRVHHFVLFSPHPQYIFQHPVYGYIMGAKPFSVLLKFN